MASKPNLRAVASDEKAPRKRRQTITQAAEGGDRRELLVTMRARVAKTVEDPNCPPRDLAALTRRLQEIAKEIEAMDARALEEEVENATAEDSAWEAV